MNKQYIEKRYELSEQPVVETISQETEETTDDTLNEIDTIMKNLNIVQSEEQPEQSLGSRSSPLGLNEPRIIQQNDYDMLNEIDNIMKELNIAQTVLNTPDVLNDDKEEKNIEEE
jgi:ribosome assembly protein YihI (activator of Der GTPase)